jgi:glycosyltransferase involved in cell wall biosynthesis
LVPDGKVGLVAEPTPASIAEKIQQLYVLGEAYFLPQLREEKKKYSWQVLAQQIISLAEQH